MQTDIMKEYLEEKENKKQFIKEVMEGIEKKKTLKDFFDDHRSYKQYRDDKENCMLWMNWDKIHRIMKYLKWKWNKWIDEAGNEHYDSTPSVFGIKQHVHDMLKSMEEYIMTHPDATYYYSGTGGFEYEMRICEGEEGDPDDYTHRVRFIVRFVVDYFDNGQ